MQGYISPISIEIEDCVNHLQKYGFMPPQFFLELLEMSAKVIAVEPNILRLASPVRIVGDIHGQFFDLLKLFTLYGSPRDKQYLFLGDYIDRGTFCIEVITLVLLFKLRFPLSFHLLRGNHESRLLSMHHNFRTECLVKYGPDIYQQIMDFFLILPLCAIIDNTYFCVHGGISPLADTIKSIDKFDRFVEVKQAGLLCDLLWSDPIDNRAEDWTKNSNRGCSYFFSPHQTAIFLEKNKLELIIRGHEVHLNGFKYQTDSIKRNLCLTIFSAPNYCDTYRNRAAVALIQKRNIKIDRFSRTEHPIILSNYMNVIQWSLPFLATKLNEMFHFLLTYHSKRKRNKEEDYQSFLAQMSALNQIELTSAMMKLGINKREIEMKQTVVSEQQQHLENISQSEFQELRKFDLKQVFPAVSHLWDDIPIREKPKFVKVASKSAQDDQPLDEQ